MTAVRYLLDTNICIYIAKRRPPEVAARFERLSPGSVGMSMVTYGELLFGAEQSQHPKPAAERLERFVELVPVLELPEDSPRQYGRIRAELERAGTPIGANDLWIAASPSLAWVPASRPGRRLLPLAGTA
jgi:tRNA(fMet)-specific endonuclease VapC